jgi:hypothetical protein
MQTEIRQNTTNIHKINLDDDDQVDEAVRIAVQDALREHKRRGESVVVWQDGKVVCLPPEQILVDDAV